MYKLCVQAVLVLAHLQHAAITVEAMTHSYAASALAAACVSSISTWACSCPAGNSF